MTKIKMRLNLFEGAAGAGAAGAAEGGNAGDAPTGKAGESVVYGKQDVANPEAEARDAAESVPSPDDRRKAFREMIKGDYKDIYAEETQKIIDRRFKETKNLEETLSKARPTIDMLMSRYGIEDGDFAKLQAAVENDDAYWSEAADEAGMTTEQYKKFQKMQRENAELIRAQQAQRGQQEAEARVQKWMQEAEEMRADYPDFDLQAEASNPDFARMVQAGIPVRHAYEVAHLDAIKGNIRATAEAQTARKVTNDIRARGMRPKENGTASQAAFTVKDDVSRLTRKDRAEIARRVAMGETIRF